MEYKRAADILIKVSDKYKFDDEEKEALSVSIGWLAWAYLYKNRIKDLKAKRDQKAKNSR